MPNILSIGSAVFQENELDKALSELKINLKEVQNLQQAVKQSRETYFSIIIVQFEAKLNLKKIRSHFQHASLFIILNPSDLTPDLVSSTFSLGINEVLSYEDHKVLNLVLSQKVKQELENRTNLRIMRIMSSLAVNYPVMVVVTRKVHGDVHRIVFANTLYQKFHGQKNKKLLGSEFNPTEVYQAETNKSGVREGNRLSFSDYPKKSNSGKKHWFDIHIIELTDPQNPLVEYKIAVEYDQTSRRQKENGVSELDQETIPSPDALLELLSESMKNVQGLTDNMTGNLTTKNTDADILKTQLAGFFQKNEELLDIVQLESGKTLLEPTSFNLSHCFDTLKESFSVKYGSGSASLLVELDPRVPVNIFCDEKRLTTSLNKLLDISFKRTESSQLLLSSSIVSERKNDFVISLKIGLPLKHLPEYRNKEIINETLDSLSSELLTPMRIIHKMGGKIISRIYKKSPTFFDVQIPMKYNTLSESIAKVRKKDLQAIRVLTVDDNEINRLILSRLLKQWNTVVTEAESGKEALTQVENQDFDIVLMDVQMPRMNGIEAAEKIKTHYKKIEKEIPILALSAFVISSDLVDGFDKWIDDFLLKPVNAEDLFHKIRNLQHTFNRKNLRMKRSEEYRIIDAHHIKKFAGGDNQFMRQLIEIFLKRTPEYVADLREAVESKNWNKIKMVAHKLKPTFTYVGMEKFTERVGSIEDYAMQKDLDRIHEIMEDVWADCQIAFDEYRDLLATL